MPPRIRLPGIPYIIGRTNQAMRDHYRRQVAAAYEVDRALYKAMITDQSLSLGIRQQIQRLFQTEVPRDSAATRLRNRCALTGRPRGVFTHFRLSRHMFRQMGSEGMLPGISKASW
jgi:small subunit ribosomal protein S14